MLSSYLLLAITLLVGIFQIEKLFPESFKAKPWIILSLLVVLTVFSFINEYYKGEDAKEAIIAANKKDHNRDSIADLKIKNSNQLILDGFGKAIGKYSLGYDSAKQEIVALQKLIKDSVNRKTTIIQGESPYINFDPDTGIVVKSFTKDSMIFAVNISSYNAASILKNASLYCVYAYNQKDEFYRELKYEASMTFLNKNFGLPNGASGGQSQKIKRNNLKKPTELIVLVKGTYTDSHGKNPQPLDIVGAYYFDSKRFFLTVQPYDDSIRIFLKKKGKIK